jgi:hypothetical protein
MLKKLVEQQREASMTVGLDLELDTFHRHWDDKDVADALGRFVTRLDGP